LSPPLPFAFRLNLPVELPSLSRISSSQRADELGRSVGELRALGEVTQAVNSTVDLGTVLTTIVAKATQLSSMRDARQRQAVAERAYASLSRYFSPNLAQELASDTDAIDLGGQRREIATLFTDITSFTALVETLEPSVLGPLLNEYLTGMTDIVFAHDGTVAKIRRFFSC
jgi:class 3 adenylate cyclase